VSRNSSYPCCSFKLKTPAQRVAEAATFWRQRCPRYQGVRADAEPSEEFCEYYTKGICQFAGRTRRREPANRDQRRLDPTVKLWASTHKVMWENLYSVCVPNSQSSFKSGCKYEKQQPVLDEYAWGLSGNWMMKHFGPRMMGSVVVDRDVAVAECEKSSSNGFPINQDPRFQKKRDYVDTEEFEGTHEEYWRALQSNQPMPAFWSITDKVELRLLSKIKENKIRSFTAGNVHHTIASAQLCLDMNEKFYRSALKTSSFVGATKFKGGWNKAIRKLLRFRRGFALDETDFDASLFRRALWGQCAFRCAILRDDCRTDDNIQAMHNLYYDIVNSIMISPKGDVIVKDTGNPSGQANTIVDNTMILYRLLAYAWICLWMRKFPGDQMRLDQLESELNGETGFGDGDLEIELGALKERRLSYDNFHRQVEMLLNGDDNTFSVSEDVIDWFNGKAVAEVWTSIGVTTKSDVWEPRPVEQLDFLSHTILYDGSRDMYFPIPERSRILDSLMLGSKSVDVRWSFLRACALRIESWCDPQLRRDIQSYIEYLWKYHDRELCGEMLIPGTKEVMKWESIAAVYMTDDELATLYCGYESDSRQIQADIKSFLLKEFDINIPKEDELKVSDKE